MPADESELDRIDPEPVHVTLSTGYVVSLQRLKTRQFFRLLKVLTRGLGPLMVQAQLDFNGDQEDFARRLLGLLAMAIPEAEQQFIEFLQSMTLPVGFHEPRDGARLDRKQLEDNQEMLAELLEELNNPELEDLIDLGEAIIRQEAPEIQSLGKKIRGWMEVARKAGLLKDQASETAGRESPARSPRRSTSSATSTAGPTSRSSTSRSAGSGSASRPRPPAGTSST